MVWPLKSVIRLKKYTIFANSVTSSAISLMLQCCYNDMSLAISILYLDNRSTCSETSIKTQLFLFGETLSSIFKNYPKMFLRNNDKRLLLLFSFSFSVFSCFLFFFYDFLVDYTDHTKDAHITNWVLDEHLLSDAFAVPLLGQD